jgi:hypothetical protein
LVAGHFRIRLQREEFSCSGARILRRVQEGVSFSMR